MNPLVRTAREVAADRVLFAGDFGMTPARQTRIAVGSGVRHANSATYSAASVATSFPAPRARPKFAISSAAPCGSCLDPIETYEANCSRPCFRP